jgi:O-acetyl-ADP-ribose deacetylase (regulator of RNase III)
MSTSATKIEVIQSDITTLAVDAIVNAANAALAGGGGVDGAIHRAAGKELDKACQALPAVGGCRCPTGEARVTDAFRLPCKKIIHTVGPVFGAQKNNAELLAACYRNSLLAAVSVGAKSIAFPNISTGIYGYPKAEAARVAVNTVRSTLAEPPAMGFIEKVLFVCFDRENYALYQSLLAQPA